MKRRVHRNDRRGFTILEFLVTISVLAVLMAIIIPAVMSARGAAQTVACRNNFRQVSVALQQYASAHRQFPRTRGKSRSSFVSILPWLDQADLYTALTDDKTPMSRSTFKQPTVFICSEDPIAVGRSIATSIGENIGLCIDKDGVASQGRPRNGVFLHREDPGRSRLESISDGLSNTASYSEILGYPRPDGSRLIYMQTPDYESNESVDIQSGKCRAATMGLPSWTMKRGSDWLHGVVQVNQYVHVLPPNERDCLFTPGAASLHRGGVQTALCDGSVRFVSTSIDEKVWQAVGSRNGSDGPVEW